jgi:hypothetical protein
VEKVVTQRRYRVWYRPKEEGSRSFNNKSEEVMAEKGTEAKRIVEIMYPGCKATSVWLLEK